MKTRLRRATFIAWLRYIDFVLKNTFSRAEFALRNSTPHPTQPRTGDRMTALAVTSMMTTQLTHLSPVDILILVLYFAVVVFIGFYVKGSTNTSEEFFLAGREMSAWIAGLSFVSANLGSLELMGWAGSAYQYGILAAHWYWIGAIPAMLFLGMVMMPFYYVCKTHSVPGYLHFRFGAAARGVVGVFC